MPDESHTHLAVTGEPWLVGAAGARSDDGVAYQAAELSGTLAKRRILQGILQHRRHQIVVGSRANVDPLRRGLGRRRLHRFLPLALAALYLILEQIPAGLLDPVAVVGSNRSDGWFARCWS